MRISTFMKSKFAYFYLFSAFFQAFPFRSAYIPDYLLIFFNVLILSQFDTFTIFFEEIVIKQETGNHCRNQPVLFSSFFLLLSHYFLVIYINTNYKQPCIEN